MAHSRTRCIDEYEEMETPAEAAYLKVLGKALKCEVREMSCIMIIHTDIRAIGIMHPL